MTALSPPGGIREKPQLPFNSCSNEVIIACQYPCIVGVQMPFLRKTNFFLDGPTLHQVPGTTLTQQVLQNSTVNVTI